MKEAGFNFEIIVPKGIEEVYPPNLACQEVPSFLAELKASWFKNKLSENEIVITADTIVILNDQALGKPETAEHSREMLQMLKGKTHEVVTGVCFFSAKKSHTFKASSKVHFRDFSDEEIEYYIKNYKPFDKAGSYGAQEWIGYIGIEHIEGSYFNVMGLPIQMLYVELENFIE
jgi:septum formation protein